MPSTVGCRPARSPPEPAHCLLQPRQRGQQRRRLASKQGAHLQAGRQAGGRAADAWCPAACQPSIAQTCGAHSQGQPGTASTAPVGQVAPPGSRTAERCRQLLAPRPAAPPPAGSCPAPPAGRPPWPPAARCRCPAPRGSAARPSRRAPAHTRAAAWEGTGAGRWVAAVGSKWRGRAGTGQQYRPEQATGDEQDSLCSGALCSIATSRVSRSGAALLGSPWWQPQRALRSPRGACKPARPPAAAPARL